MVASNEKIAPPLQGCIFRIVVVNIYDPLTCIDNYYVADT